SDIYIVVILSVYLLRVPPPNVIYPLSLHDALPILDYLIRKYELSINPHIRALSLVKPRFSLACSISSFFPAFELACPQVLSHLRSEEHTSELQSRENLVCRLLLEKKNIT